MVAYVDRVKTLQEQMVKDPNLSTREYAGLTAEDAIRGQIKNEIDGQNIAHSGVEIAKRNANIMRRDMARYRKDRSKYTQSLGAASGSAAAHYMQAAQDTRGSLDGVYIYGSGWQWAAMSSSMSPLPDTSTHPKDTVPKQIDEIYRHLHGSDLRNLTAIFGEIDKAREGGADEKKLQALYKKVDNYESHIRPIIADIDAGFGNADDTYKLAVAMIKAGACCIQLENQASDQKQCGHQDGKVTVPMEEYLAKLRAVRKAFQDMGVKNGVVVARTDSVGASLTAGIPDIRSPHAQDYIKYLKVEEITNDNPAKEGEVLLQRAGRTVRPVRLPNGLYQFQEGTGHERAVRDAVFAIKQAGADSIWIETSQADLKEITNLAASIVKHCPDLHITYNNSPSFAWTANTRVRILQQWAKEGRDISAYPSLNDKTLSKKLASEEYDQTELAAAARDYIQNFQKNAAQNAHVGHHLITLPEFHGLGYITQMLARGYFSEKAMLAYVDTIQDPEFKNSLKTVAHQFWSLSDVTDEGKKVLGGKDANVAAGAHNTQNQFFELLAPNLPTGAQPLIPRVIAFAKAQEKQATEKPSGLAVHETRAIAAPPLRASL